MEEQLNDIRAIIRRMSIGYAVALLLIAFSMLGAFWMVNRVIEVQQYDAKRVNISGRQRMLGQRMVQLTQQMAAATDSAHFHAIQIKLDSTYMIWKFSHQALRNGSKELGIVQTDFSDSLEMLYKKHAFYRKTIASGVTMAIGASFGQKEKLQRAVQILVEHEEYALFWMNRITETYTEEATTRVNRLANIERFVIAVGLMLLILEALIIFIPLLKLLKRYLKRNIKQQWELHKAHRQIEEEMYELKELTQDLKESEAKVQEQAHQLALSNQKLLEAQKQLETMLAQEQEAKARVTQQEQNLVYAYLELKRQEELAHNSADALEEKNLELKTMQSQLVQSEKMASVGQMVAGIAHEINNPVNFVSGGAQTLESLYQDLSAILEALEVAVQEPTEERQRHARYLAKKLGLNDLKKDIPELIADINLGANKTAEIVKGLRTFSRMDNVGWRFANLHEIIDASLIVMRSATPRHLEIEKQYDPDIEAIECHPGELGQVFINLISNACDALKNAEDGKIQITTIHQQDSVRVTFADNGAGIPSDIAERIFDPFFSTKEVGKGTGLGLSITHGIIQRHHGKIWIEHDTPHGVKFHIELPKYQTDH